jgi:hypothetical protein
MWITSEDRGRGNRNFHRHIDLRQLSRILCVSRAEGDFVGEGLPSTLAAARGLSAAANQAHFKEVRL